jgi:hypothetical protein
MNKKQQFLNAVQTLAPGDKLIFNAAQGVREESLPVAPGATALEFVMAMQRLNPFVQEQPSRKRAGRLIQVKPARKCCRGNAATDNAERGLPLSDAIRVKSAEYWLKLGQPVQAMSELQRVSEISKKHPWVVKAVVSATGVTREMNEHATAC